MPQNIERLLAMGCIALLTLVGSTKIKTEIEVLFRRWRSIPKGTICKKVRFLIDLRVFDKIAYKRCQDRVADLYHETEPDQQRGGFFFGECM